MIDYRFAFFSYQDYTLYRKLRTEGKKDERHLTSHPWLSLIIIDALFSTGSPEQLYNVSVTSARCDAHWSLTVFSLCIDIGTFAYE